jgi:PAS domain S-box-containing protein
MREVYSAATGEGVQEGAVVSTADARILLVDDVRANLLALEATLEPLGHTMVRAGSGREALKQVLSQDFAAILLDVHMPELDGFETARLIRSRARSKRIPILFMSAVFTDLQHIQLGYESGAIDYILKPFDPNVLRSKVEAFAQLYLMHRQVEEATLALAKEREAHLRTDLAKRYYHDFVDRLDHAIMWEASVPSLALTFVSRRAEEMLGYPIACWMAEADFFLSCVPHDDRAQLRACLAEALETKNCSRCEHRMVGANGEELWFHTGVQVEPQTQLREECLRGLTVDITPIKREEEELRRRDRAAHSVVEARLVGEILADTGGTISAANDRFLEIAGYSRDEIAAGRVQLADLTPPEEHLLDERALRELAESGTSAVYEKACVRKNGDRVPVLIGAAMLPGSADQFACFVVDLSARRHPVISHRPD